MVEETVEDGGGDGGVAIEDGRPLLEGFVSSEHDGAAFVAGADDLEEKIGPVLVDVGDDNMNWAPTTIKTDQLGGRFFGVRQHAV